MNRSNISYSKKINISIYQGFELLGVDDDHFLYLADEGDFHHHVFKISSVGLIVEEKEHNDKIEKPVNIGINPFDESALKPVPFIPKRFDLLGYCQGERNVSFIKLNQTIVIVDPNDPCTNLQLHFLKEE